MALEEGRKEGAREAPYVASLGPESEPGANLAAQTEVVDELGPNQGQKVEMPARFPTPRTTVEEGHAGPPRQWAAHDRDPVGFPALERDARATLQVEAGESYEQLRGVMLECEAVVHRDTPGVAALGREIFSRYASPRGEPAAAQLPDQVAAMVERQAAKRVALEFIELRRASWDHRKLGGVY